MGKKAEKRAQLREEQKIIVALKKEERRQAKLDRHEGYNVTNKVFMSNKFLRNLYQEKKNDMIIGGAHERFCKYICVGIGLPEVTPSQEQCQQIDTIMKKHNMTSVFSDFVRDKQGDTNVNMRILNGFYLILLGGNWNITKDSHPGIQRLIKVQKIGKHDFERWISTAVNKTFPKEVLDELMLVFKTERELQVEKMKYRNPTVLNKSPIAIQAYCQKNNLEYVNIRTKFDTYRINAKDLFKGGPFENVGLSHLKNVDDDGTIIL